jgi:hypothetical protein
MSWINVKKYRKTAYVVIIIGLFFVIGLLKRVIAWVG